MAEERNENTGKVGKGIFLLLGLNDRGGLAGTLVDVGFISSGTGQCTSPHIALHE